MREFMTKVSDYLNERRNNPDKQEDRIAVVIIGAIAVVVIVLLLLLLWRYIAKERSRKEDALVSTTYEEHASEYMSQGVGEGTLSQEYLDNIAYLNGMVEELLASLTQVEQSLSKTVEQYQEGDTELQKEISSLRTEVNTITRNLKETQIKLQDLVDIVLVMNDETIPIIQAQIAELYENMNQIYTDMTNLYTKLAANALQYRYDEKENTLYLEPYQEGSGTASVSGSSTVGNLSAYSGRVVFNSKDITYLDNELDLLLDEIGDSTLVTSAAVVLDSADKRRNLLTSHGTINYDSGKVVANAASLLALADKTDTLANAYAAASCRALNNIGTYYNMDGEINYESQVAGTIVLSCARIVEGILQSQSVEHLAAAPVIADNITAGAAAWVNGKCIIGNGADNERAYQHGIEDGAAENKDDVDIKYTYHAHTGDSGKDPIPDGDVYYSTDSPGGCYTAAGHSHNETGACSKSICGGWVSLVDDGFGETDWGNGETHKTTWKCSAGHTGSFTSSQWGTLPWDDNLCHKEVYTCGNPVNTWEIGCGKMAGQIETAEVIIRKSKETLEGANERG